MNVLRNMVLAFALCLTSVAVAQPAARESSIVVTSPELVRPLAASQPASAYVTMRNTAGVPDVLLGASSPAADRIMMHRMSMHGTMMMMDDVPDGVSIAPGKAVSLADSGIHLMVMGIRTPLVAGTMIPFDLKFARAGVIRVNFVVRERAPQAAAHGNHGS